MTAAASRYAVLLRGVNVGGHAKVPMARLREIAADLGYGEPATYLQSGNLVVSAPGTTADDVGAAVARALRRELDVTVDVMVRRRRELDAVIAANPFADLADDPKRLVVVFLAGDPAPDKVAALEPDRFDPERFEIGKRCMYQWFPDGMGRSKMAAAPWDRWLGVRGTARNWRTVLAVRDLLGD
jgi:uncharacterized protein (DUF1697 family)